MAKKQEHFSKEFDELFGIGNDLKTLNKYQKSKKKRSVKFKGPNDQTKRKNGVLISLVVLGILLVNAGAIKILMTSEHPVTVSPDASEVNYVKTEMLYPLKKYANSSDKLAADQVFSVNQDKAEFKFSNGYQLSVSGAISHLDQKLESVAVLHKEDYRNFMSVSFNEDVEYLDVTGEIVKDASQFSIYSEDSKIKTLNIQKDADVTSGNMIEVTSYNVTYIYKFFIFHDSTAIILQAYDYENKDKDAYKSSIKKLDKFFNLTKVD